MPKPPESTKNSLRWKLREHAANRWPQLTAISTRFRGQFVYVYAALPHQTVMPLMRLRLRRLGQRMGIRDLPSQQRQIPGLDIAQRRPRGQPRRSPRLRLRPIPQRPHRMATTPDELTNKTT
jgi:hypothetical protein